MIFISAGTSKYLSITASPGSFQLPSHPAPSGEKEIVDVLKVKTTLTTLDFSYNDIGPKSEKEIDNLINLNKRVKKLTDKYDSLLNIDLDESNIGTLKSLLSDLDVLKIELREKGLLISERSDIIDQMYAGLMSPEIAHLFIENPELWEK